MNTTQSSAPNQSNRTDEAPETDTAARPIRPRWALYVGWFAGVFGALTVFSGGTVLFVGGPASARAGAYVPFVVGFNFLAGFAYIAAAVGLVRWRPWVRPLSAAIAGLTILVFAAFGIHILEGGAIEPRTVAAMTLRSALWVGIAFALYFKRYR